MKQLNHKWIEVDQDRKLTLVLLIFRIGTFFFFSSVSISTVAANAATELRDDAPLDDQERKGLHRLLPPIGFVRVNTFIADASGGGAFTSLPRLPVKKTACNERGMRLPSLLRSHALSCCFCIAVVETTQSIAINTNYCTR